MDRSIEDKLCLQRTSHVFTLFIFSLSLLLVIFCRIHASNKYIKVEVIKAMR